MTTAGLGAFFLANAIINDLKNDLLEINVLAKEKRRLRAHVHATERLCDFIRMHNQLKEFSDYEIV